MGRAPSGRYHEGMGVLRGVFPVPVMRRSARSLAAVTALCAIAAGTAACGPDGVFSDRPQRIILLSMDTMRADRVSGYGADGATPTIAEIAAEGTLFRRAWAASSYTLPSHMSMFTGLDPAEHGVHRMQARLSPDVPTLAMLLRDAGYRTQAFHEGIFVAPRYGFERGFDSYEQVIQPLLSEAATRRLIAWILEAGDEPYFLFLHTYHVHFPYGGYDRYRREHPERGLPTREQLEQRAAAQRAGAEDPELAHLCTLYNQLAPRRSGILGCGVNRPGVEFTHTPHAETDVEAIRRSYAARVAQVDAFVARLRDVLVRLGRWDDTLLLLTSDHGDAFFEHDLYRHAFVPFDEVLRVPMIFSFPNALRADGVRVVDGVVSHLDLLPTILGFAGAAVPDGLQGVDLGPVMRGRATLPEDRRVYPAVLRAAQLEQVPLRRVAVGDGLKWIEGDERFGDAEGYLFDIERDPAESENLRATRPELFADTRAIARSYESGLASFPPVDQSTGEPLGDQPEDSAPLDGLPEETRERLRALGYGD